MGKIINGEFTSAVIYSDTDTAENYAIAQTKMICDNEASKGSRIRVMPDVHPGVIGPVGLTMSVDEKIIPGLVGTDIGCGVSYMKINKKNVEFQKLDKVIRERIPVGRCIREEPHRHSEDFDFDKLRCKKNVNIDRARLSLGTLGSGNHFIELDKNHAGELYLVVHSGSRSLGKIVAEYYMKKGHEELKKNGIDVPYEMTYLEGQLMEDYLHDLEKTCEYAMLNREIILSEIARGMKWKEIGYSESIHNYVDENMILRKGAVSAYAGEKVIIPINMKDGVIIGTGKGNSEWNCSAPHGAGRIINRSEVKKHFTVSQFKKAIGNVYFAALGLATLDEAPFAYRGIEEIKEAIKDTVEIDEVIKPIYNYRASGERCS